MSAQPEAGWYPMPDGGMRYWDGAAWLDIPAPPTAAAASDSVADGGGAVTTSVGESHSPKVAAEDARARDLAKVSWWLSAAGLFLVPFAFLGLIGGLVARHRDRGSEWKPAVGIGAFSVISWMAIISLMSITGWQIVGAQVVL